MVAGRGGSSSLIERVQVSAPAVSVSFSTAWSARSVSGQPTTSLVECPAREALGRGHAGP